MLNTIANAMTVMNEPSINQKEDETASLTWVKKLECFLKRVSAADVPVLMQGETGVGKEVLARQICASSPRANKPFLKLNCAALPSELVESELFGYERGAFTGAFRNVPGKFELRMAARSCWMKSATWISSSRPNCCRCCRTGNFNDWVPGKPSKWMCG